MNPHDMVKKPISYQILIGLVLSILFSGCSFVQNTRSRQIEISAPPCIIEQWPHENSDLKPDPSIFFGKLPNGFRYVLMQNHEPKNRVSMHLDVRTGSLHENDDEQGLAHFLEHMMFNGSKHFPKGELVKYFQSIGMDFGNDANAHTAFSETVYDLFLPSGQKQDIQKALLVMDDYARGAFLDQVSIDQERSIILAEKRTRDSSGYRTHVASMNFLFPSAKLSKRMPIGDEQVIKVANKTTLEKFYKTWYIPSNMILVVVGDFDPELTKKLITDQFQNLVETTPKPDCPDFGNVQHSGLKTFYHFEPEAGNTTTSIQTAWFQKPIRHDIAFEKDLLIKDMACKIFQYRLNTLIEKGDAPFSKSAIYSGLFLNRIGYAELEAESKKDKWEQALSLLENMLRQALEFGFAQNELQRVKKEYLAKFDAECLAKDSRNSANLARQIIENLNENDVTQSPQQEKEIFSPIVSSVTLKDLNASFNSLFALDHRLVCVTGDTQIKNQSDIADVFNNALKNPVLAYNSTKTLDFPYLPEPKNIAKIKQRIEIFDLNIERIEYENGVWLNLKPTDFKKNEILVNISFGFGTKSEPSEGLSMLSEDIINQSGLGRITKTQLQEILSGKNTSVGFQVDENCFLLKGNTIPDELEFLFQLLYAYAFDTGYREEAYNLVMKQNLDTYNELTHSIEGMMKINADRFFANNDTRFGFPKLEKVTKLKLSQVRSWIDPIIKESNFSISVVGDFNPDKVKDLVSKYFGSIPARKKDIYKKESVSFPKGKTSTVYVDTKIEKGMVIVAWPTLGYEDIHKVRRLSVLGAVLNERMRESIREKLGATYSQFAYNQSSKTYDNYGTLRSVLTIAPKQSVIIIDAVKKISTDITKKGISDDELKRSLSPILTGIKDMIRTNRYWLETVLTNLERKPEQLDWCRTISDDYSSITSSQVMELSEQYLKNKNASTLVIIPK